MTTPLNSPEFDKIRTDAIKKSEAQAEALGKKDHFSDVIDTRAEVDAFFDIAYKSIDAKLKQTKDPRLQQKIVELKAVYASKEAIRGKYYRHNEKIADEYWQELISVFEKEERAAIKHGPDFFKSLGIDGQVSLEKFDTEEGEIKYHMKKDSVNFTLLFKKDGQMKMTAYVNRNDWLHFIKSAPRKFIRGDYREIVQSVSLMELRDLSAFQLHFSRYNSSSLQSLLRELSNDLHKLPKRTTNPNLKPLIAFRDEMDALSAEISKEAKNSSYNLTEEKINSYKQKIESFFERRLIDLNAMDPSSEEAKKLAEILEGIVEENPMLIEVVTRNAKSPQDLAEWDVRNSWEQPYLHHEIETKRSELSNASNSTLTKMTAFKQLSPKHKEVCKKILLKGLISTKNSKKIDAYLRYLNGISKEILSEYSSYVNEIQLERFLANPEYLAKFTRYAKGLNYSQFRVYCHLWKENKYGEQFKESATILKDYKNEEDLDIVKILNIILYQE